MLNPKTKIQNPKSDDPGLQIDRELARRIGEGDREALARWLDRHLSAVYGYVARRLGPGYEDVAADVARATFSEALRRLGQWARQAAPLHARGATSTPMRLWLLKLAGHFVESRVQGPESKVTAGQTDSGLWTLDSGLPEGLRETLGRLPRGQQVVMSLALFEGMGPEEIAAASGRGVSRAMRDLRRALKRTGRILVNLGPKGEH